MNTNDIRDTVRKFLDLVERSSTPVAENERTLKVLLDQLALASHGTKPSAPVSNSEAPSREYDEIRTLIASRFPNYGLYRAAGTEPNDELLAGDAIDDIYDIAIDLSEVKWLWDNIGEADAMWQFYFSFETHWGSHLRSLQWYVHELEKIG